jgi:hypothetical protein
MEASELVRYSCAATAISCAIASPTSRVFAPPGRSGVRSSYSCEHLIEGFFAASGARSRGLDSAWFFCVRESKTSVGCVRTLRESGEGAQRTEILGLISGILFGISATGIVPPRAWKGMINYSSVGLMTAVSISWIGRLLPGLTVNRSNFFVANSSW